MPDEEARHGTWSHLIKAAHGVRVPRPRRAGHASSATTRPARQLTIQDTVNL
jgi:hypothetical protein